MLIRRAKRSISAKTPGLWPGRPALSPLPTDQYQQKEDSRPEFLFLSSMSEIGRLHLFLAVLIEKSG